MKDGGKRRKGWGMKERGRQEGGRGVIKTEGNKGCKDGEEVIKLEKK